LVNRTNLEIEGSLDLKSTTINLETKITQN